MMFRDETGPDVWLIGLPALGHPGGSRYLRFREYLNTRFVDPPIKVRFFTSMWGWRLDSFVTKVSPRPYYTVALLLMECRVALHMFFRRDALYHAVKGDVDMSFAPKVSRMTGNALVASFHEPTKDLVFWQIDKRMTRHLAGVILLGECQREHFRDLMPPERIFVVPHGVDTAFFGPVERTPEHPTLITVGSHLRDASTLTRAMQRVWEGNPDVRLIVVGARRPHDPNPAPDMTDSRVEYLDHIDDHELLRTYARSSVAVLSLKNAVANNALLEAMSVGLPVVASDVGGIREYLGDDAGILFPAGDDAAFAKAVLQLVNNPELSAAMGRAGRERALRYDYKVIADMHAEAYATIRKLERRTRVGGSPRTARTITTNSTSTEIS